MGELEKLKLQLGITGEGQDGLLGLLLEDAREAVKQMTNRENVDRYGAGIRAVAVLFYNRNGREGESSYSAGDVSIRYQDLPEAVKSLLPAPLAVVGGKKFE